MVRNPAQGDEVMRTIAAVFAGLMLASVPSFAAPDWAHYSSDEFGFAGLFPVTPTVSTENKKVQVNGSDYVITMHTVVSKGANGSICLAVQTIYTWPIDIEGELAADRDNFVKGVGATVTSSKRTTAARGKGPDLPALLFDASMPTYDWRSLVVIDGQAVYEVAGGVPKGGETADLDRCVKNFALTPRN